MNRFVAAIAITSTIIFTQACSAFVKSQEAAADKQQSAQPMGNIKHSEHSEHQMGDMNHSQHATNAVDTQAKLTVVGDIKPKTPVSLMIDVQDKDKKAITHFNAFQEKLMHLIVVSDDLQSFSHIHPTYKQNGRFKITTSFPQAGGYTLFSDYKPAGKAEQVSVLKTQIPGTTTSAPKIDRNRTKTFGDIKANLTFSQPALKTGQEVTLMFDLRDKASNQPLSNLQPYLGERGHLVILKQSSTLTRADYIHAHALKDTTTGQVSFMTSFPQPGKYKLWGQFNRNGKIITTDFWVNVV